MSAYVAELSSEWSEAIAGLLEDGSLSVEFYDDEFGSIPEGDAILVERQVAFDPDLPLSLDELSRGDLAIRFVMLVLDRPDSRLKTTISTAVLMVAKAGFPITYQTTSPRLVRAIRERGRVAKAAWRERKAQAGLKTLTAFVGAVPLAPRRNGG